MTDMQGKIGALAVIDRDDGALFQIYREDGSTFAKFFLNKVMIRGLIDSLEEYLKRESKKVSRETSEGGGGH